MSTGSETGALSRLLARLRGIARKAAAPAGEVSTRSSQRFPVQLPLRVKYGPAMSQEAEGEIRNLSVGGVFFLTPDAIPAGSDIEMLVPVPPPLAQPGKMWMFCTARVVRSQQAVAGQTGIGAVISGYKVLAEA